MNKRGFTLIELLIVVAIIAILAAIAIPNFLAAQTRSKVARTQEEMRTLATALESYYVDNNYYPLDTRNEGPDDGGADFTFWNFDPKIDLNMPEGTIWCLTTPVSYITKYPSDLFYKTGRDKYFQYAANRSNWLLGSCGPDNDSEDRGDLKERDI
ncbi:MAG: prepilin-type N-terminal cleavage/methylation domain-containing protein, partial [bacterium]|nr:prepilin-type N-terminal cleavage/methylation domain-containing protein [bacterium]